MAKFKSAYFLIAGLLFILDQTNAGRGRGRSGGGSGGGRCEGDSACEQTVLINNNSHHNNVTFSPDWLRDKEITDLSDRKRDTIKSLSPRAKRG